jgi:hypothetical protein
LLATVIASFAVPASAAEFRVGVVAGGVSAKIPAVPLSVTDLRGGQRADVSRRTGFTGGGAVEWGFGDLGNLRIEPRFVQKGTEFDVVTVATGARVANEAALSYLDVPIMYRSEYFKKRSVRVYVMSGIGPNFLLSAKVGNRDVKDNFKGTELGLVSCVGFNTNVGQSLLSLDFRLGASLLRIDKGSGDPKSKNSSFQLVLGITIPTGN